MTPSNFRTKCHIGSVRPALVDAARPGRLLHVRGQSDHPTLLRGRHLEHLPADGEDLGETGKDDVITPAWLMLFLD